MRTRDQIFPWVAPALRKRLRVYAARKGATESAVVETALHNYFDAETTDRQLIMRRLDRHSRGLAKLQRDFDLLSQAFGVFIQVWFAHTPRIPQESQTLAEQSALRRYRQFLDHVAEQISAGSRFTQEIVADAESDTDVQTVEGGPDDGQPSTK
jgi:hypothetical protein